MFGDTLPTIWIIGIDCENYTQCQRTILGTLNYDISPAHFCYNVDSILFSLKFH